MTYAGKAVVHGRRTGDGRGYRGDGSRRPGPHKETAARGTASAGRWRWRAGPANGDQTHGSTVLNEP